MPLIPLLIVLGIVTGQWALIAGLIVLWLVCSLAALPLARLHTADAG